MRIGTNSHAVTHVRTTRSQDASTPALFWHGADWPRAIESFRFVARNVAPGQFWLKRTWQLLGRLDGTGYGLGLGRTELPMLTRVLCTSDICDALRASRPYRAGMPTERVLEIMGREVGAGLDATCFEALQIALGGGGLNHAKTEEVPAVRLVSALADDYRQAA